MTKAMLSGIAVAVLLLASGLLASGLLASSVLASSPAAPPGNGSEVGPGLSGMDCPSAKAAPISLDQQLAVTGGHVIYTAGGCKATASCADGSTVSCSSSSSSGTCSFQDSSCSPRVQGWVECDGLRRWCPSDECETETQDCDSLDYPGCDYFWNSFLGCCDVNSLDGEICLDACG